MANTVADRISAVDRLVSLVQDVSAGLPTGAQILHVYRHEPQALFDGRVAAVVYRGDAEPDGYGGKTWGHVLTALRFDLNVYWPVSGYDPGYLDDIELEVMNIDRAIVKAVSADRDLGGTVSALTLGDSDTSYISMTSPEDAVVARKLSREVRVQLLDAEAVAL